MKKKLLKDIKMKSGEILPAGLYVEVQPHTDSTCLVCVNTAFTGFKKSYVLRYISVFTRPSDLKLCEWLNNSMCKTPTGKTVEIDGHDSEGYPSWCLILNIS